MIDIFSLLLSHGLLLLTFWRLLKRDDLDNDAATPPDIAPPANKAAPTRPFDHA